MSTHQAIEGGREQTPAERAQADRQSPAWAEWQRERLADLASTSERRGGGVVTFREAAADHRDPPGTIRYVVIAPDGSRIPAGARLPGEGGASAPPGFESGRPYPRGPLNGGPA